MLTYADVCWRKASPYVLTYQHTSAYDGDSEVAEEEVYIYIDSVFVCVCVCVCARRRGGWG
jgi:hypothetical protein